MRTGTVRDPVTIPGLLFTSSLSVRVSCPATISLSSGVLLSARAARLLMVSTAAAAVMAPRRLVTAGTLKAEADAKRRSRTFTKIGDFDLKSARGSQRAHYHRRSFVA